MNSENCLEVDKYRCEGKAFELVVSDFPRVVTSALNVVSLRLTGRVVVAFDVEGNRITLPGVPDVVVSTSFANTTVIYLQMPWSVLAK